jgi:hypothetical protein
MWRRWDCGTYIWDFVCGLAVQDVVEDIDGGTGLESNTGSEALVVDVLDEFLGASLLVRGCRGLFGGSRADSGFIVEAVEVTAGVLELLYPFLGLLALVSVLF